jgi:hypothetical protein
MVPIIVLVYWMMSVLGCRIPRVPILSPPLTFKNGVHLRIDIPTTTSAQGDTHSPERLLNVKPSPAGGVAIEDLGRDRNSVYPGYQYEAPARETRRNSTEERIISNPESS